jgi:uncharacterized protein YcfL
MQKEKKMKYQKLLLIVLAAVLMTACSSHKMGMMSSTGTLPQVTAIAFSVSAL